LTVHLAANAEERIEGKIGHGDAHKVHRVPTIHQGRGGFDAGGAVVEFERLHDRRWLQGYRPSVGDAGVRSYARICASRVQLAYDKIVAAALFS
jgi:hypothetical protein